MASFLLGCAVTAGAKAAPQVNLTSEERSWLNNHPEKLVLWFNIEFPPIEFSSASGTFIGMGADVITQVEHVLGVTFVKRPSDDWNAHLAALKSGECAVAPTIVMTLEREAYAFFTTPYATVPVVIITTNATSGKVTLDDFSNRRLGVVSGYATEQYLRDQALVKHFEVVLVNNVPEGLENVAFGQMDAFVENLAVAAYYIDKKGIPNLRVAGTTDFSFAWSIGVSRRYPLLYSSLQKALDVISEDELAAIRKKWISLESEYWLDPKAVQWLKLAALFMGLLLAGLLGINFILKRRLNQRVADLRRSEEKFRTLFQKHAVVKLLVDPDTGRIVDANEKAEQYYGWTGEQLRRMRVQDINTLPPEQVKAEMAKARENQRVCFEFQHQRADGSIRDVQVYSNAMDIGGKTLLHSIILDVTEHKRAEKALRESEARYRELVENANSIILRMDCKGRITFFNEFAQQFFGYEAEEVLGRNVVGTIVPERDSAGHNLRAMITDIGRRTEHYAVNENENMRRDGTRVWISWTNKLLYDAAGAVTEILCIGNDITQRKQAEEEREKLQAQLSQTQKMESIGRLAGGVAHDFNNMIGVILGHTELALEAVDPVQPLHASLMEIRHAAERSAELTRQLLAFARKQTIIPKVLDLNETVEGMLKMLQRLIGENIELVWRPGKNTGLVKIDPSQIDQILANLCVNARDAIKNTGKVIIETDAVVLDAGYCAEHPGAVPGEYILLGVSDNGCGMDRETLEKLFEPFFTTKTLGKGTGLGLATVYGIVKQNNGFIDVCSEPGHGAAFKIYLPRYTGRAAPSPKEDEAISFPTHGHETILVVEDEPGILKMTLTMLERQGYTVLAASTPGEAIRLAERYSGEIHLLITDVVMPELNGYDLAKNILALHPNIKYLFMSGYTADIIAHHGVLGEGGHFIQKPFTMKDLAAKVRDVLEHKWESIIE